MKKLAKEKGWEIGVVYEEAIEQYLKKQKDK